MKLRFLLVLLMFALGPASARAQDPAPPVGVTEGVSALTEVLMIGSVLGVMREEGIVYGTEMQNEMFPGQGGAGWQAVVEIIYDPATLQAAFDSAFAASLVGSEQVPAIAAFFGSDLGQRILTLEIEARRALLDEAAEEAAKLTYAEMAAEGAPLVTALKAFVETNDLVESNVIGSLNASLAFFRGLSEGGPFAEAMPEDDMLAEVWAQEPDVRAETLDWLYPYLALAYKPLSIEEFQAYLDFSATPAGQTANAALFAAFDAVFVKVSRDLGRAAATQMQGQEL